MRDELHFGVTKETRRDQCRKNEDMKKASKRAYYGEAGLRTETETRCRVLITNFDVSSSFIELYSITADKTK